MPGLVLGMGRFSKFCFDLHYHLEYHIGLVTEGVQRQRFKGQTVLLGPGCVSLMPPGEIHDGIGEGEKPYTLKTFRLSFAFLRQVAGELTGTDDGSALAGTMIEDPQLAAYLASVYDKILLARDGSSLAVQSDWLSLVHSLIVRSRANAPQAETGALSPAQRRRVKDYCLAHLAEKITLEELAAVCGLGRFRFLRHFKQSVGMTPHAWLLRLRLEEACALLTRGSQSIAEVAQAVGFYDQSHFNRAFRQAFGVAPSSY